MFKIQSGEGQELKALIKLRLSLLKVYPDAFLGAYSEEKKRSLKEWRDYFFKDNQLWVVKEKGRLMGMVFCARFKYQRARHVARMSGLGVLPELKSQGVGRALVEKVIAWVKDQRGIRRLQIETFADNQVAVPFYKKMGFKEESRTAMLAKKKDGTYQDALEMVMFF